MSEPLIDIRPDHWAIVADILRRHVPDREVWVFGSRATWNAKEYSDLDLAVIGETPLSLSVSAALADDFAESALPFKVDVVDWATTSESFRKIIERDKAVLQRESKQPVKDVAGEWRQMPFSQAVMVNPRVQLTRGSTYPFVDMGSVNASARCVCASEQRTFDGGGSRFAVGDTLMARITPCLENGKIARFCGEQDTVAHGSTEFIVIRGRERTTDTAYAYYLTKWDGVSGYAISQMTGTSGRQRVPSEALDHLEVPVPPLPEQRAIAHILGTLDDKIELNRRMNETLEAMARALFKSWFVHFDPVRAKQPKNVGWGSPSGRNPPDRADGGLRGYAANPPYELPPHIADLFPARLVDSELGEIPEGWDAVPLYDIATYINGGAYGAFDLNGERRGLPIIKIAELKAGVTPQTKFSDVQMPEKYRITRGDILFSWSGNPDTSIDTFVWSHDAAWLNQHIFRVVPHRPHERAFVLTLLKQLLPVFAEIARNKQTTGLGHVTAADMKRLLVVRPDDKVKRAWNAIAAPMLDRAFLNEVEISSMTTIRDTLLPRLISGELRVRDAGKVLADATV